MTPLQFDEVCAAVAQCLQLPVAGTLARGDHVVIDGVTLGLAHDEAWDEQGIFCFVVLGEVDPACADGERVLREVLSLNLELDAGMGESIGMEPGTKQLILRGRIANGAEDVYPHQIAERMSGYVQLVNELYDGILSDVMRPAGD